MPLVRDFARGVPPLLLGDKSLLFNSLQVVYVCKNVITKDLRLNLGKQVSPEGACFPAGLNCFSLLFKYSGLRVRILPT
jgi:hypothetical protein